MVNMTCLVFCFFFFQALKIKKKKVPLKYSWGQEVDNIVIAIGYIT